MRFFQFLFRWGSGAAPISSGSVPVHRIFRGSYLDGDALILRDSPDAGSPLMLHSNASPARASMFRGEPVQKLIDAVQSIDAVTDFDTLQEPS